MNEGRYLPQILSDLAKAIDKLLDVAMEHKDLGFEDWSELDRLKDSIQYIIEK